MSSETLPPHVEPQAVLRKVYWRIVPLVFVLYIVSYLDRANISFAVLQMKELPEFTPAVLGWGFGIFFPGYLLLEIPGALLVERWSARKWFARILVTWGLCSMGMALVRTPWQFYLARFLLGLAEAGFFPGVIVYFSHWFPRAQRGRALAGMILAVPFSQALGAFVSGQLIQADWYGLAGWQWLFLVEGLPAVLLGVAVPFLLADRPRQARWLAPAEREWLEQTLDAERHEATAGGNVTLRQVMLRPTVWLLALGIFAANTGGYALGFWLPTTVKGFLKEMGNENAADADVLAWVSVYYGCGLAGVWLSGRSSDATGERKWHCAAGMTFTGLFLAVSMWQGLPWEGVFTLLCLTGFFAYFWPSPFWVLPTLTLSTSAAAVAIGFINICANMAGLLGAPAVGWLKTAGIPDRTCLLLLAACYAAGGAVIALLRIAPRGPVAPKRLEQAPKATSA